MEKEVKKLVIKGMQAEMPTCFIARLALLLSESEINALVNGVPESVTDFNLEHFTSALEEGGKVITKAEILEVDLNGVRIRYHYQNKIYFRSQEELDHFNNTHERFLNGDKYYYDHPVGDYNIETLDLEDWNSRRFSLKEAESFCNIIYL